MGTPPPPLTESPLSFYGLSKRAKNDVLVLNKVKHGQKRAKKYEKKKQKIEFLDLKYLFFSKIFPNRIQGYPAPPPLHKKSFCPKTLSEIGGYPRPLAEKSAKFWRVPSNKKSFFWLYMRYKAEKNDFYWGHCSLISRPDFFENDKETIIHILALCVACH